MKTKKDCNLCRIVEGTNPHKIVYMDDLVMGFYNRAQHFGDLQLLWSPLEHLTQEELLIAESVLTRIGHLVVVYSKTHMMDYRLVMNVGKCASQAEEHAHMHQIFSTQHLSEAPFAYHPGET